MGLIFTKKNKDVIYDDINVFNKSFLNKFNIIFCLRTIYYVTDNIKIVINNLKRYLRKDGLLIISYNLQHDSYSNRYITDIGLKKILNTQFKEELTVEINRDLYSKKKGEKITVFVFKKK